jgi:hypothetical protein
MLRTSHLTAPASLIDRGTRASREGGMQCGPRRHGIARRPYQRCGDFGSTEALNQLPTSNYQLPTTVNVWSLGIGSWEFEPPHFPSTENARSTLPGMKPIEL